MSGSRPGGTLRGYCWGGVFRVLHVFQVAGSGLHGLGANVR